MLKHYAKSEHLDAVQIHFKIQRTSCKMNEKIFHTSKQATFI